ncbi:unnamed protein product [Caenorhabditis bovis]|uniref:Apical junction molecule ajm1 alpha/beta domain-containing protein n=1 Tax=Caenorhabditis bovis TaxID=2654633 RepID=A0A8S1EEX2_9PELO|nr:unnamed protein product [Caenorhabditis bovis]
MDDDYDYYNFCYNESTDNVCMDIEKLKPPADRSSVSRQSDSFNSFLQTAISAILAFIFSLRIILRSTLKKITNHASDQEPCSSSSSSSDSSSEPIDIEASLLINQIEEMEEKNAQHSQGMPSVLSLLQTDEMPSSCSDEEPSTSGTIPLPSLLQSNMSALPNFLHTINEEESDEVRSLTGSSLASPRTVVDRRLSNISLLSPILNDDDQSSSYSDHSEAARDVPPHEEQRTLRIVEVTHSSQSEDDKLDLLKELAKIGTKQNQLLVTELIDQVDILKPSKAIVIQMQPSTDQSEPVVEQTKIDEVPEVPLTSAVLAIPEEIEEPDYAQVPVETDEENEEETSKNDTVIEVKKMEADEPELAEIGEPQKAEVVTIPPTSDAEDQKLADADRDQEEELVFNEERRKTVTLGDDNSSLRSASITLDPNREEVDLNESFASNPTDESAFMQRTKDEMEASGRPKSPLDLPPPPSSVVHPAGPPPPPPPPLPSRPPVEETTTTYTTKSWTSTTESHETPKIPLSNLSPAQPPPSILSSKTIGSGYPYYSSGMSVPNEAPPPPPPPAPVVSSQNQVNTTTTTTTSSTYQPYQSGGASSKSISSSREDLLSEHATSRSTVREIPVQRAPSTAPSHATSILDYRIMPTTTTTYHHVETPTDEYYRREVMTRTIITRSTEALSQAPLVRPTSPLDRYIPYTTTTTSGDGRTREERTVDYKVTYHRDIEEEERRIREDQARRRQEEQERRAREEENRRAWEQREREELQRLREQQTMAERAFERSVAERERAEKERIERDRIERQKAEMIRRAEWERREKERIDAEEAELARRRALEKEKIEREKAEEERRTLERLQREKERLERERAEAERLERERIERERIELERIERERIEIERVEKIKRERLERERREREKEREEEERLRREREELERIERERRELEIRERQELENQRREAEDRERQRLEDEACEMRRREEERREAELLADVHRKAEERERLRRRQEREEAERLERIRLEQQRIDMERADAERRERERREEERRELELFEAARRKKEARERERLEELERERQRNEEERKERERREQERRLAAERERQRRQEEEEEIARLNEIQRAAAMRQAQREAELQRQRERDELDRKARQLSELEQREKERRERERLAEEAQLAELREKERRNQEIRERERREAAERENNRRLEDRRSRDKLDYIARERSEKEKFEAEKRRLLAEKEAMNKKKHHLLSHETLAKLTQPLYYTTREPEVTTKVERQVIERIDRNLWVEDVPLGSSAQNAISYLDNDENNRDRMYNPNDLTRNGSSRSRYHRAKMDKARRDFYSTGQDSTDPLSDRFRKSNDDLTSRSRLDYRGPLLQKFHESEFRTTTYNDTDGLPYRRMGPSPYEQPFAKLLEETERKYALYNSRASNPGLYSRSRTYSSQFMDTKDRNTETNNRAESVVAYDREARRESPSDAAHIRSRSADYLMDRKIREETEVPENQLQKTRGDSSPRESRISEYEMRFRKSTEKLTVPDWYREHLPQSGTTNTSSYRYSETQKTQQHQPVAVTTTTTTTSTPITPGGVDFPRGMFDRYRDEIEDLRRSRSSLHQVGQEAARQGSALSISGNDPHRSATGYTVSEVPNAWNMQTSRTSRVVEVADTFVGTSSHEYGNISTRYGGRVTVEEVLDSIFQKAPPVDPRSRQTDKSYPQADEVYQGNLDGPSIYTNNYNVMRQVIKQPDRAEHLLENEELYVRCAECHRTRELSAARLQFVSCKHCYTYYCSRECRLNNWKHHSGRCSFARINTLCKDVIMKVREDEEAQAFMSKVARDGFASGGRGSVNIRLASPQIAQAYVSNGWRALSGIPLNQLLYYYTVAALVQEKKEPSLIALCRRYEPREKFILSVSIIADIEHCPETPPPETRELFGSAPFSSPRARYEAISNTPYFSDVAHNV